MRMTLNEYKFIDAFNRARPNQFSHEALRALFDYYEEIAPDMEFDPIAICCEWSEVAQGDEEHLDAEESGTYIIMLDNGNVLIQEY